MKRPENKVSSSRKSFQLLCKHKWVRYWGAFRGSMESYITMERGEA
jgi:hypothetical protein